MFQYNKKRKSRFLKEAKIHFCFLFLPNPIHIHVFTYYAFQQNSGETHFLHFTEENKEP